MHIIAADGCQPRGSPAPSDPIWCSHGAHSCRLATRHAIVSSIVRRRLGGQTETSRGNSRVSQRSSGWEPGRAPGVAAQAWLGRNAVHALSRSARVTISACPNAGRRSVHGGRWRYQQRRTPGARRPAASATDTRRWRRRADSRAHGPRRGSACGVGSRR